MLSYTEVTQRKLQYVKLHGSNTKNYNMLSYTEVTQRKLQYVIAMRKRITNRLAPPFSK